MAYDALCPFGDERADFRAGTIAAPLINLWSAKGSKKARPKDWIHIPSELHEEQSPEDMRRILEAIAEAAGSNASK